MFLSTVLTATATTWAMAAAMRQGGDKVGNDNGYKGGRQATAMATKRDMMTATRGVG